MSLSLYRINSPESKKFLQESQYIDVTNNVFYWIQIEGNDVVSIIDDFFNPSKSILREDEARRKIEQSQFCLMTIESFYNHFTKVYL